MYIPTCKLTGRFIDFRLIRRQTAEYPLAGATAPKEQGTASNRIWCSLDDSNNFTYSLSKVKRNIKTKEIYREKRENKILFKIKRWSLYPTALGVQVRGGYIHFKCVLGYIGAAAVSQQEQHFNLNLLFYSFMTFKPLLMHSMRCTLAFLRRVATTQWLTHARLRSPTVCVILSASYTRRERQTRQSKRNPSSQIVWKVLANG